MPTALFPPTQRAPAASPPRDGLSPEASLPAAAAPDDADYQPEEEPLESFLHGLQIAFLLVVLEWYLHHQLRLTRWALGGHGFLFYDPLNRRRHVGPDFWVDLDVDDYPGKTWEWAEMGRAPAFWVDLDVDDYPGKTWEWAEMGRAPAVILELVSPTTVHNDLTHKRDLYERLQVREYFCYDDEQRVKVAHRLVGNQHVALLPRVPNSL